MPPSSSSPQPPSSAGATEASAPQAGHADAASPLSAFRQLSSTHESDRHVVAAALHNRVGQAVSAIKMSAHLSLDEVDPAQRRDDLLEIIRIADDTVAELRDLYAQLRPPQLEALGLEAALRGELDRAGLAPGVQVRLSLPGLPRRAEPEIETACFRIAQQCLHAVSGVATGALSLSLQSTGSDALSLELRLDAGSAPDEDSGIPLDPSLMQARAAAVGGSASFEGNARSFVLAVHLPCAAPPVPRTALSA
jgi:glucose-6-phosphate-specific signal transduction histidine kinase